MARHVALVGATASGKSALALAVARARPEFELVSADSMQVYRGMDVGTAKPSRAEQAEVRHHLIDLVEPHEEFAVATYQQSFRATLVDIEARDKRALLVGGTGLYVRAAVDGLNMPGRYPDVAAALAAEADANGTAALHERLRTLDPVAADRMLPSNRRRVVRALEVTLGSGRPFSSYGPGLTAYPPTPFTMVGVALPSPLLGARIAARYQRQLEAGFVDEVRALASRPAGLSRTARQALGYKELLAHVEHGASLAESIELAVRRTRRFARRQRVWFRRDPRIEWLEAEHHPDEVLPTLLARIKS